MRVAIDERLASLVTLLLGLVGCSESQLLGPGKALTASETHGHIVLTGEQCDSCSWLDDEFYVVRPEQLSRVRKSYSLTYLGTQDGFHFLKAWNKMLKEFEIDHVALPVEHCDVASPLRIDEESSRHRQRRVELTDARCLVR